jgi:hypothetical protein
MIINFFATWKIKAHFFIFFSCAMQQQEQQVPPPPSVTPEQLADAHQRWYNWQYFWRMRKEIPFLVGEHVVVDKQRIVYRGAEPPPPNVLPPALPNAYYAITSDERSSARNTQYYKAFSDVLESDRKRREALELAEMMAAHGPIDYAEYWKWVDAQAQRARAAAAAHRPTPGLALYGVGFEISEENYVRYETCRKQQQQQQQQGQ